MKTKKLLVCFWFAIAAFVSSQAQTVYNEDFEKNSLEIYDELNSFHKIGNLRFPQFEWEGTSWLQNLVTDNAISGKKSLQIIVNNSGSDWWTLQALNDVVPVKSGESYKISFKMASDKPSKIIFRIEVTSDFSKEIVLNGDSKPQTFSFISEPMTSTGDAKIIWAFGKPCEAVSYLLDDIVIEKVISYDWLQAPAIVVEGDIAKVAGPNADKFTKFTVNNGTPVEGTEVNLLGLTGEVSLKAESTDGKEIIRLKINK